MINWELLYKQLIDKRGIDTKPNDVYTERHHIIPKHAGGDDSPDNIVRFSLKDHTLAHYILWRWKGDLGDKVAYLMKSGQTEKGNIERIKYAVAHTREISRKRFIENPPMRNPVLLEKAHKTRRSKYNGKYHSEKGINNLRLLCNSGAQHSPEAIAKRTQSMVKTRKKMSDEEYFQKYIQTAIGENNPNYGKKRPGKKAGNYGKSKGVHILVTPDGERIEFSGIRKLLDYGVGEVVVRNWRNKGVIQPAKNNNRSPWVGYEILYIPNEDYGSDYAKTKEKKRSVYDWSDL